MVSRELAAEIAARCRDAAAQERQRMGGCEHCAKKRDAEAERWEAAVQGVPCAKP